MKPLSYSARLTRNYSAFTVAWLVLIAVLMWAESKGLSSQNIGLIFLGVSVILYTGMGIACRTTQTTQYYVAGREVPGFFNGMASAADWMSAASFISVAGTLYLSGFGGLAYVLGWTGGFCLLAFFIAPYLRRFGQYTISDFLAERYDNQLIRLLAVLATAMCSFMYIVAQIHGVGLITTRLTGVEFQLGIFIGLGCVLVCSFLGGMKAVTWTQTVQCIILLIAYLVPVFWLTVKLTGVPAPLLVYGQVLEKVADREVQLSSDKAETQVHEIYRKQAQQLRQQIQDLPASWDSHRVELLAKISQLRAVNASENDIRNVQRTLEKFPATPSEAKVVWSAQAKQLDMQSGSLLRHAEVFPGKTQLDSDLNRRNFLALIFCLMVGTTALPHLLSRFYTTTTVSQARVSVFWALLFIALLYTAAPVLAILVKYIIYNQLVGTPFSSLPAWITRWSLVDTGLIQVSDINRDGILQLAEMKLDGDVIMLAAPEIAGLPYTISALVAAGGLAAALSTADGLLLTIANAFSHDMYFKMIARKASPQNRVLLSKFCLLVVALIAASIASRRPTDILLIVSATFSLAASVFFPVLMLGVFWKRANAWGAIAAMLAGAGVTIYYLVINLPWLRELMNIQSPRELWWGIEPISAGVFGVPAGFIALFVVSLLTPKPSAHSLDVVAALRKPSQG